jgi:hypothetical protein
MTSHLLMKNYHLPRQARDTRNENSTKGGDFTTELGTVCLEVSGSANAAPFVSVVDASAAAVTAECTLVVPQHRLTQLLFGTVALDIVALDGAEPNKKRSFIFAPFSLLKRKPLICQDRLRNETTRKNSPALTENPPWHFPPAQGRTAECRCRRTLRWWRRWMVCFRLGRPGDGALTLCNGNGTYYPGT